MVPRYLKMVPDSMTELIGFEDRRVKVDLIEMYKSSNKLEEIKWKMSAVVNYPKFGVLT